MFNLSQATTEASFTKMSAGVNIKANLVKVGWFVKKDGEVMDNLCFEFKGTDAENPGTFKHIIWANSFDEGNAFYTEAKAKQTINNIAHILTAVLTPEEVAKATGSDFQSMGDAIIKIFEASEADKVEVLLKVILNAKDELAFPNFPSFVASKMTPQPRILRLDTAINKKTGLAWDRITPKSAPAAIPSPEASDLDSASELDDAFGKESDDSSPF